MREIPSRDYLNLTFRCAPTNARRVLSSSRHALRNFSFSASKPGPATPMQSYAAAEVVLDDGKEFLDTGSSELAEVGFNKLLFSPQPNA